MRVTEPDAKRIVVKGDKSIGFKQDSYIKYIKEDTDKYEGEYEFTPSESLQTIEIENLMATKNIIINPIPSNYGRISWNGSIITVS